jgi:hypothetical protein
MRIITPLFSLLVLGLLGASAKADISNGGFDTGLGGWETASGTVVWDPTGFAVLKEHATVLASTLQQVFAIPGAPLSLSFEHEMSQTGPGPTGFSPDFFTASLLDPVTQAPILSSPGYTDYFYRNNAGLVDYDASIVTIIGDRVTLDLTSLPGGRNALLAFDLYGFDDGCITQVRIDNVRTEAVPVPIPEPVSVVSGAIGLMMVGGYLRRRLV